MKVTNVLQSNTRSPPFSHLRLNTTISFPRKITPPPPPALTFLRNSLSLSPLRQNPSFKVVRVSNSETPVIEEVEGLKNEEGGLFLETCITRSLTPALTVERGLDMIREEIVKLNLNPPCCRSGLYRIQVAVPPSAKALNWFCSQPVSGVFPQFFISSEKENPTYQSLSLNGTRGIFGVGAAVYFTQSSPCMSGGLSSFTRYLSPDSSFLMAYGFVDIKIETGFSTMKNENGSFYYFIPQVELAEYESISILTATLVWKDSSLCTYGEAVHSFELSLDQVSNHCLPIERFSNKCIRSSLRKFNVVDGQTAPMVHMKDLSLDGKLYGDDPMDLKGPSCFYQFCFRLSLDFSFASNMLNHVSESNLSLREYSNINTLWASLIIEEFARLGLTYFCVAPGSRSSPLAIAAATHPHTTCIACFDERSLSFHAVGYARGSHKPAVVITSSGTAVSNLLPAVVEAFQDFVPLLLLTADRPPELQDTGANQAINQVNHFGSFVRHFFNLPAPTDQIPARMILTTVDSAVYHATCSPYGPVHINCPFREPLEDTPQKLMYNCLNGLTHWMSSAQPMTKYMKVPHCHTFNNANSQISDVVEVIQGAKQGILLIGAIHTEDDIWAALLLAKHLSWPVVADILSGVRLRKLLASFSEHEERFLFVDHLDHALLSNFVRKRAKADVIIQIGSRITSKRIYQMLEECCPLSYIMVDNHPFRHDHLHIVTHRIQSTILEFADCLFDTQFPQPSGKWRSFLHALNTSIAWEMSFQICSNSSLSEPYVAHVISKALSSDSALFMGNSMVIRDADMYGQKWVEENYCISSMMSSLKLQCHWLRVAGNRGASGIDGLLSTAIGFAVGCRKRVLCVIGDVSFLHDTNGLALLNQRIRRKPMTILVINNHGGAIFSLLPIADRTDPKILDQYFYTSHNISIRELCVAHGVNHLLVQTKMDLQDALFTSQQEDMDYVIEVESSIDANAIFHSNLKMFACQAADHALNILSKLSDLDFISDGFSLCKIQKMEYSLYRVSLCAPPTSISLSIDPTKFYREGFILTLFLDNGSVGYGEVAPLDTSKNNMLDVEDQLKFLLHVIKGAKISYLLPLLKDSFSSWIWSTLGVPPSSILPSVRCGLEMAVLNSIAAMQGLSLLNVINPQTSIEDAMSSISSRVKVCALLDSLGTPTEVAHVAMKLVEEGFSAIKLKVARREDPLDDAAVVREVRRMVGNQTELRADANRKWTYEEAVKFGISVKSCDIQYIEEPVQNEEDIIRFCEETGLSVALDETIDNIQEDPLRILAKFNHAGIASVVIKPSVVGGFENAALIAKWAHQQRKMAVISATFESSLALSAYVQFCCHLELQNAETRRMMNKEPVSPVAHGLGTYKWLKEDVTVDSLKFSSSPGGCSVEASVVDADCLLKNCRINQKTILASFYGNQIHTYRLIVDSEYFSCQIKVQEIGSSIDNQVLVFVHGFLGTGEDWMPIMKAISGSARCITFDLPGHGESEIQINASGNAGQEPRLSIEATADILYKLILSVSPQKVTIIGYSMGARIALYMALKYSDLIDGAVIISGSPGLKDEVARNIRKDKDDSRASSLVAHGLELFLDTWYTGYLWKSLRDHPQFNEIIASRLQHDHVHSVAKALSDSSVGRQKPLWKDLKECKTPLMLIVGENDNKFKKIAKDMLCELSHVTWGENEPTKEIHEIVEVPKSGHAVHLENPLHVIRALRKFLTILETSPISKPRLL